MSDDIDFVPSGFIAPRGLNHASFRLVPLGPEHNERDYRAWTSSVDHIKRTPGFERGWPVDMTLEDNLRDLERHASDFTRGTGFTYSVLIGDDVIGCVYIYPGKTPFSAVVRSWVSADYAHLDRVLHDVVNGWLATDWKVFKEIVSFDRAPESAS